MPLMNAVVCTGDSLIARQILQCSSVTEIDQLALDCSLFMFESLLYGHLHLVSDSVGHNLLRGGLTVEFSVSHGCGWDKFAYGAMTQILIQRCLNLIRCKRSAPVR